ncbi:MAG: hypothetical protein RTU30_08725 [Candidatus Thorarchaeota archaeon]
MLLQFTLLEDPLIVLLVAILLCAAIVGGLYSWAVRVRVRQVSMLDSMLLSSFSISVAEIAETLDKRQLDRSTIRGLIKRSENGVLSFGGTRVLSYPLMYQRIREILTEEAIVHVQRISSRWDVSETVIGEIMDELSSKLGLDVVLTKEGDYLLVPDLKARMKDALELHGRIEVHSEAQRMSVPREELVRLIETWNWKLFSSTEGPLLSVDWLARMLERIVERDGFLNLRVVAERFMLSESDIIRAVRLLNWKMVSTTDGRLIPEHLLQRHLQDRVETEGILDLKNEEKRLLVNSSDIQRVLKGLGLSFVNSKDGSIILLDYLRERLNEDLELTGVVTVRDEAKSYGIDVKVIEGILRGISGIRQTKDGRFVSIWKYRLWLLDEIRDGGIIEVSRCETLWGMTSYETAALIKRFGIRVLITLSGDFLSLSWTRRWIQANLKKGRPVKPDSLAKKMNIRKGEGEAILAQIDTDALLTKTGSLLPTSSIMDTIKTKFTDEGLVDLQEMANEMGLDLTDLETIVEEIELDGVRTSDDKYIEKLSVIKPLRWRLQNDGIYDLLGTSKNLRLNMDDLLELLESELSDSEILVENAGMVVSSSWVQELRKLASSQGYIRVTSFARERGLRRSAVMLLFRRFLKGAYIPRSDSYVVQIEKAS